MAKYLSTMGFSTDVMHDFVAKEIKSIYSSFDGWNMTPRKLGTGYDTIIVLERRKDGHREFVKVLVTFGKTIPSGHLDELTTSETNSDGTLSRNEYAVMVPANADTSSLPQGMKVFTMKSFAYDGNRLMWVKKPVRKSADAPANVAA